jgi:hypothetical protein
MIMSVESVHLSAICRWTGFLSAYERTRLIAHETQPLQSRTNIQTSTKSCPLGR